MKNCWCPNVYTSKRTRSLAFCLTTPTPQGDFFSVAICSDGSYGIEQGLIFSYPIRSDGKKWEIVQGVPVNEFSRAKITATENELREEKSLVSELLPK